MAPQFNKNRALKVLRECNQILFLAEKEQDLLDEVCRIIVEAGGYRLAWVGYPNNDIHKSIQPVAYCGYESAYLESQQLSWADSEQGQSPAGLAIRTAKSFVIRDIQKHSDFIHWREAAEARAYASVVAFPLFIGKEHPAVISMYAAEADALDNNELELLENLAGCLAYGIEGIRVRDKRNQAEKSLRESEEKFRTLVRNIPGITYRCACDKHWTMEYISDGVEVLSGYPATDFINNAVRSYASIIHRDDSQLMNDVIMEALKQMQPYTIEFRIVHANGTEHWVYEKGQGIFDDQANLLYLDGVIVDITERKHMEIQLKHLATHDPLTGLYNRNVMMQQLNDEIQRASRYKHDLSVFMLDIDHFKAINDSYGHSAGDSVLRNFAQILEGSIRNTDYPVRYGGEEFIIILPETPLAHAEDLAGRIRQLIAESHFPIASTKNINLTASIGIATFPAHAKTGQHLLEVADTALYSAKNAGRNQVKSPQK
ncbi:hypothetical protein A9Q79_09450 [Methylophaga sp. 42_25_T18]|nr:hypothetical protein A9Q79_09450 [Methylophaga sp. 42_25_T18]OUR88027.1 hypothetical protein A9Q92_03520 [Methylophaga sp. 42_8_T64]